MDLCDLSRLKDRFGEDAFHVRVAHQRTLSGRAFGGPGKGKLYYWHIKLLIKVIKAGLALTTLGRVGEKNAKSFEVHENEVALPDLSPALDNLRILHLSDLHIDSGAGLTESLSDRLRDLEFDLVLITGDFRFHGSGDMFGMQREMAKLAPALRCKHGVFGVLGNHDFLEQTPLLEDCGVRILLNESHALTVSGTRLWIVGVDDPHLFGLHDLDRAAAGIPQEDLKILLAHSPEIYSEASRSRCDLYLCGHTHGGQFCFPGGFAPILGASCPRRFCSGSWRFEGMLGYTSRGVGSSGVFARFFCPPEIVVHRLVPSDRQPMASRHSSRNLINAGRN